MAIPARVTQPLLAEMRYVWWREQMDGVFAGLARKGHPVLEALTDVVARHGLDRAPFDALIEAQIGRVHGEPPDLDAFYGGPDQDPMRVLAGPAEWTADLSAERAAALPIGSRVRLGFPAAGAKLLSLAEASPAAVPADH